MRSLGGLCILLALTNCSGTEDVARKAPSFENERRPMAKCVAAIAEYRGFNVQMKLMTDSAKEQHRRVVEASPELAPEYGRYTSNRINSITERFMSPLNQTLSGSWRECAPIGERLDLWMADPTEGAPDAAAIMACHKMIQGIGKLRSFMGGNNDDIIQWGDIEPDYQACRAWTVQSEGTAAAVAPARLPAAQLPETQSSPVVKSQPSSWMSVDADDPDTRRVFYGSGAGAAEIEVVCSADRVTWTFWETRFDASRLAVQVGSNVTSAKITYTDDDGMAHSDADFDLADNAMTALAKGGQALLINGETHAYQAALPQALQGCLKMRSQREDASPSADQFRDS